MIKTELELALRLTVDLSRPVRAEEQPLLQRAMALAKDISAMRGHADPALPLVEKHLGMLPVEPDPEAGLSVLQVGERKAIIDALASATSMSEAAGLLGVNRTTLYGRVLVYGLTHRFGQKHPRKKVEALSA